MGDCWEFLDRFCAWHEDARAGRDARSMEEAGFTPSAMTASIREARYEQRRVAVQLRRAYKGRLEKHNEVVRLRGVIGQ